MHNRVDTVEKAHKATYGWIFGDAPNAERDSNELPVALFDETARKTVDTFVDWLSSGTGVYHIAGKLGSGKSTLTKYLAAHDQVRKELQKWAGRLHFPEPLGQCPVSD
jgi:polynucleotide 5'-kinase involved in rRNA processing